MNISDNYPFFSKIFLELVSNNQFKSAFQAFAPEIYADIESASTNPNCSCRSKVENYVNNNKAKCITFLNNFIELTGVEINLQEISKKYTVKSYAGTSVKVKISEWKEFSEKLVQEKAIFRSFSTSKIDDDYINVFFL